MYYYSELTFNNIVRGKVSILFIIFMVITIITKPQYTNSRRNNYE